MSSLPRQLAILYRSERLAAKIRARTLMRKIALFALAGLAVLFALGMLNIAGFYGLEPHFGAAGAALAVAGGNLVLAIVVAWIATTENANAQLEIADEVRDAVLEDILKDAEKVEAEIRTTASEVSALKNNILGLVRKPLSGKEFSPLLGIVTAVLSLFFSSRK